MTTEPITETSPRSDKIAARYVLWSAWAIPLLLAGDLMQLDTGWYAALPIGALLYAVLKDTRVRALRYWVGALAVLYAIPYFGPDGGMGLVQDMHPVNLGLFAIAGAVVLGKLYRSHRA